ncbi:MAG TPA: phosphohistidine phosphatase SixA [Rhodothermales bacterium]
MRVYLVRHGIAEDPRIDRPDFDRALTDAGVERIRGQASALRRAGMKLDRLLTSPLVRARQTAELLGETLGVSLEEEMLLAAGCSLDDVQEVLGRIPDARHVMIVGHQPDLGEVVRQLTGGIVKMRKGTVADVEIQGPGARIGVLRGLYDPEVLAALGA